MKTPRILALLLVQAALGVMHYAFEADTLARNNRDRRDVARPSNRPEASPTTGSIAARAWRR